ncbi:MAG: hypothetical protein FJY98_00920 [Candidatus Liptonbacteria bacterium]|nr:hypothetical protein [Candidatus Liptonbacteria bacterium]
MPKAILAYSALLILGGLATTLPLHAQSAPQVIISWRASTFTPAGYLGKPLPTAESRIEASVEALQNGRLIDLSKETIYWYVDNNFVSGGTGIHSTFFRTPPLKFSPISLRVEIPTLKEGVIKGITIPVVFPEAVMQTPSTPLRPPLALKGLPFFFNVDFAEILSFDWIVNGEKAAASGEPDVLTIKTVPAGAALNVTLSIYNPFSEIEAAKKANTLIIP